MGFHPTNWVRTQIPMTLLTTPRPYSSVLLLLLTKTRSNQSGNRSQSHIATTYDTWALSPWSNDPGVRDRCHDAIYLQYAHHDVDRDKSRPASALQTYIVGKEKKHFTGMTGHTVHSERRTMMQGRHGVCIYIVRHSRDKAPRTFARPARCTMHRKREVVPRLAYLIVYNRNVR